jgi:CheY-like chemotaxis protein
MKEQFAANVSHELRTPLNIVLGYSEMMYLSPHVYGDLDWPPILLQDIQQIYNSSRHLLEMIDDVLDLSRIEMVGFTMSRVPTPLGPLLQGAAAIAQDLFRDRPIELQVDVPSDLPILQVDRTRIRQVLLNLLSNAARFGQEGTVRLQARHENGEVVVGVSDTGPGIPQEELAHLFEEFYQVDRLVSRKHGGAGLGLAICKHFVEAHDGRVWAESQVGLGSTFYFSLPIPGQHVPVSNLTMGRPLVPSSAARSPLVLVLDRDPTVADLVRRHLGEVEVVIVEDTDHVAEAVTLHHPQAVVWNMPPGAVGRGTEVIMDGAPSMSVPVIECSLPSRSWMGDHLSVAGCLGKPVRAQDLLREIRRLEPVSDILIIDDDWSFCQLMVRTLAAADATFCARCAYDGEEGIQAMRAQRPDLVLLDIIMPRVDGLQVLAEMRRERDLAHVPVILLTASTFAEDAIAQRGDRIVLRHPDGLSVADVLCCLRNLIGVVEPDYDERSVPESALIAGPGGANQS